MALAHWDKKAQATFAKIMEVVPEPMREAMKPQLITMIENKASGDPVTTDVIERLVRRWPRSEIPWLRQPEETIFLILRGLVCLPLLRCQNR